MSDEPPTMSECQYPNGGCLRDDNSGFCPLCDELGADMIAEHYSNRDDSPENDDVEGNQKT